VRRGPAGLLPRACVRFGTYCVRGGMGNTLTSLKVISCAAFPLLCAWSCCCAGTGESGDPQARGLPPLDATPSGWYGTPGSTPTAQGTGVFPGLATPSRLPSPSRRASVFAMLPWLGTLQHLQYVHPVVVPRRWRVALAILTHDCRACWYWVLCNCCKAGRWCVALAFLSRDSHPCMHSVLCHPGPRNSKAGDSLSSLPVNSFRCYGLVHLLDSWWRV
jgi:hypothetical protein